MNSERQEASRIFFGDDDPRPVRYWPGADGYTSKQRRFLGWFTFSHGLEDGRKPGQVAVEEFYSGRELEEAQAAVQGARYVLAIVTTVLPGRGIFLELEDERFEVRSRILSQVLVRDKALVSYLVPSRPRLWIPGPGWMEWPIAIGPNMRRELKRFQLEPLSQERLLQTRDDGPDKPRVEHPRDENMEQAVARMTEAATAAGKTELILSMEEWEQLVLKHLNDPDILAFGQIITEGVGEVEDVEDLNRWLGLAMNIWNTTPRPGRSGRTAYEMSKENPRGFEKLGGLGQ
ncbi:MAG: hypothetical protein HY672_01435 [Chloroflexi bacterium]|nr:hypothetical protein [Chloroflexota bacterium]